MNNEEEILKKVNEEIENWKEIESWLVKGEVYEDTKEAREALERYC